MSRIAVDCLETFALRSPGETLGKRARQILRFALFLFHGIFVVRIIAGQWTEIQLAQLAVLWRTMAGRLGVISFLNPT